MRNVNIYLCYTLPLCRGRVGCGSLINIVSGGLNKGGEFKVSMGSPETPVSGNKFKHLNIYGYQTILINS